VDTSLAGCQLKWSTIRSGGLLSRACSLLVGLPIYLRLDSVRIHQSRIVGLYAITSDMSISLYCVHICIFAELPTIGVGEVVRLLLMTCWTHKLLYLFIPVYSNVRLIALHPAASTAALGH